MVDLMLSVTAATLLKNKPFLHEVGRTLFPGKGIRNTTIFLTMVPVGILIGKHSIIALENK